jgi:heme-degrading monooxygenase HmoA
MYAFLPALLVLLARFGDTMLITYGWKKNPYLQEAILHRTSPQIPDEDGNFHDDASAEGVTVFMLGAKLNHPLGLFSHNVREIGDYLGTMVRELENNKTNLGFYGGSSWTTQDKNGATELLFLSYWRSADDIHNFAYGPTHRKAWEYWNETVAENDHFGINHEIFQVAPKNWEAIYVNFQPTLLGATSYLKKGDKMIGGTVDDKFISPLIDATRGKLRSSAGRLGRDGNLLYEKHGMPPKNGTYEV